MSPKQIHPHDCERHVDKICAKIRTCSSKNLSYAGGLQQVNSVLSWVEYSPTQIYSLVWKSFCKTKDQLIGAGVDIIMEPTYSIKKVYESLRLRGNKIHWGKVIWFSTTVPRHQFIAWLSFRQRLLIRDRLKRMNLVIGRNVRSYKGSKLNRQTYCTAVDALVYFIWTTRNDLIWSGHTRTAEHIIKNVQYIVKHRIPYVNSNSDKNYDDR
ncbi:NAD(P)H-quinone oxidoreductase chain 4, partial [Bienertia sinuspersici]